MNPRKARASYSIIAQITGVSEKDVQTINSFYWSTIRTSLSNLVSPTVTLTGLGEMKIKHWNIAHTISKLTGKAKCWETTTMDSPVFKSYTTDLNKVMQMKVMVDHELEREAANKLKRKEYELHEHHSDLEK